MKNHVIIVAGGGGSRMQSKIPKQFLLLEGKPILLRTLERFAAALPEANLILVLPKDQLSIWKQILEQHACKIPHLTIPGGDTRFESVKNGLQHTSVGLTAVHDGVRPFPSVELIKNCFSQAAKFGSAVPVIPVTDTIRQLDNSGCRVIDRTMLRSTQTPQCFDTKTLKEAYDLARGTGFTDCASVLESFGNQVHLIEGEAANIKITIPADLDYASWLMERQGRLFDN